MSCCGGVVVRHRTRTRGVRALCPPGRHGKLETRCATGHIHVASPCSGYFQNVATTNDAAMQPMPTSMFQLPMAFMNGMYAPPM
ncbi:hypothetical protein HMPREF1275_00945 [Propionibacterium sp. KPL1844]|nr:hypothetical protein HMPREF1275_00945 [Propionibacterium sp. KPL1844]